MIATPGPHGYPPLAEGTFQLLIAIIAAAFWLLLLSYWWTGRTARGETSRRWPR